MTTTSLIFYAIRISTLFGESKFILAFPFPFSSLTMKFVSRSIVDQDKELEINDKQNEQGTVNFMVCSKRVG